MLVGGMDVGVEVGGADVGVGVGGTDVEVEAGSDTQPATAIRTTASASERLLMLNLFLLRTPRSFLAGSYRLSMLSSDP
jgi:hypothetical protein